MARNISGGEGDVVGASPIGLGAALTLEKTRYTIMVRHLAKLPLFTASNATRMHF